MSMEIVPEKRDYTVFDLQKKILEKKAGDKPMTIQDSLDHSNEINKNEDAKLHEKYKEGLKKYPNKDFYIYCLLRSDPMLPTSYAAVWGTRRICPTPSFDQVLFKYMKKIKALYIMWSIPNVKSCVRYMNIPIKELRTAEREQYEKWVIPFYNGELEKLAKIADIPREQRRFAI